MSTDWLKIEANTPEKEEVLAITCRMGWDDADLTVGKLFKLWRWFDQHTVGGNAARVTTALLDRVVGVSGFCEAVRAEGWLDITDAGVSLPRFDRHNGKTAKARAQTAKRVEKHKGNAKGNAASVTEELPAPLPSKEREVRAEKQDQERAAPLAAVPAEKEPDPIFGAGLDWMVKKGSGQPIARAMLGKLRQAAHGVAGGDKDGGDLILIECLAEAMAQDVINPFPWLRQAIMARGNKPKAPDPDGDLSWLDRKVYT